MASPITCDDVNRFIFSIAPDPKPFHESEQVYAWGDPKAPCTGVAVAWWAGRDVLRQAADQRLNLVITHEDPIMEIGRLPLLPHRSPMPMSFSVAANRERMRLMVEGHLVVHRHHWNLDLAPWGIPAAFIEEMGWTERVVYSEKVLRIVELPPTPVAELAAELKARLKIPFVRVAAPRPDHLARRVGLGPGGYGQGWGAVAQYADLGCDTVLVGDMIHAAAKMGLECGMAVLDGFHHATEQPGLRALAAKLREQFPDLLVKFFEEPVPWEVV